MRRTLVILIIFLAVCSSPDSPKRGTKPPEPRKNPVPERTLEGCKQRKELVQTPHVRLTFFGHCKHWEIIVDVVALSKQQRWGELKGEIILERRFGKRRAKRFLEIRKSHVPCGESEYCIHRKLGIPK